MFENFFKHIDIDPKNAHILDGNASNLEKECLEFENKIQIAGGVELFVGGILNNKSFYQYIFTIKLK
jgi:glucosamine-6-phosphate deaminase